jgi:cell division protein FtsQ
MSGATMKRNQARKPTAKGKPRIKAKPRKQPSKIAPLLAKFWDYVPVKAETVERAVMGLTVLLVGGAIIAVATFAGVPQYVGTEIALAAGRAGYQVKRVEVKGLDRMESLKVYAIALDQHSMAMPLVDLDKVRTRLMDYGWIADARV